MNRRISTLIVALVPIVAFLALLSFVTVPFVSLGPGPTFNTIGGIDGEGRSCTPDQPDCKPVVEIKGTDKVHPTTGHLNMTTVSQSDGLSMGQALALWLSGREQLVPRDLVYPPGKSTDEVKTLNSNDFKKSEYSAEDAALSYLKNYPSAVTVEVVSEPGPSADKLQEGDAIDMLNNKPVANLDEFTAILQATKPGDSLVVDYRRKGGSIGTTTITLGKRPDADKDKDQGYGFLGVSVRDAPWAPFTIDFNLANVGGPSAGLMFSLAVVDKLTTGDLNDGKFVAGTGTITADGKVGPIGGITHKMLAAQEAGATIFLVPAENCDDARSVRDDDMQLIKVETLTQAVDALHTVSAGGEPPSC